jgi:hypothetical protein
MHVLKPRSFPQNRAPNKGETSVVLWITAREKRIPTKIEHHFAGFFHQIKVRHPTGRQDFMQTLI